MRDTAKKLFIRHNCSEKCQICSGKLDLSGITHLQLVDITTPYKKLYAYARTESARMKVRLLMVVLLTV